MPGSTPVRSRSASRFTLRVTPAERVSEDPVARVGRENREILRHLLVRADRLVTGIEEQLVLADGSADISAELILIEEGPPDAGLVIEPVVGREVVVPVVPENLAVELVAAARRGECGLGRAARRRRGGFDVISVICRTCPTRSLLGE